MNTDKLMFKDGLMAGERILVTGGGTGLGKEMAEGFLKLGAEVHICGRRGGVCEETANELMGKHGGKVVPHACDIRVPDAITDMNDKIWAEHGALTGLINNAAGNFISRTEDLSVRGFDAIANIVFRGTFYMTHDIGTRWIKAGDKGSVTAPDAEGAKRMDSGGSNPMGRVGEMHELVNLAVFLMGPGAEYVNGQTIAIDGAMYNATGGNFYQLTQWGDEEWKAARDAIEATNAKDRAKRTV